MEATNSEKKVKAPAAETKKGAPAEKKRPVRLMYMGPNIPGGRLMSGRVFKGGYPAWCADLFERLPEAKELFIPVDRVMEVQKKLKESGSNEARLYQIVKKAEVR
ncbi:MAG: hypothetical protein ACOYJV_01720 [Aminivibrio sp.]|jgi:hypothetical protein